MGNAELTPEDYAAADEALGQWAESDSVTQEARRDLFAWAHATWGTDKFRLRNRLREPRTEAERIDVAYFAGILSEKAVFERRQVCVFGGDLFGGDLGDRSEDEK